MKNKIFPTVCLLLCIAALLTCKKEKNQAVEESPFFVFFDQPAIHIDTTQAALSTWQYGFTFVPLADGKITQFGVKLPVTGAFKVRLWDLSSSTPTVLSEHNVTSVAPHTPAFAGIPSVDVKKGALLGVTVLADSFYHITKQDATDFTFPLGVGNISILSFNEMDDADATTPFPATTNSTQVAPCVNVVFIAD